jgi:large subunit ribosomal protein L17
MAQISKLNRPTKERMALIRGQASSFLWDGKIETTVARAKTLQSYVEKILTLAINTYEDTVKVTKTEVDSKGVKVKREVVNDGPKKLAARRAIMSKLYDRQEQRKAKEPKATFVARTADINHPLIEKIFNVYAPKYAERAKELGQRGGYTRILKLGTRRGDNTPMALVELV